jgi:hypothetical protein
MSAHDQMADAVDHRADRGASRNFGASPGLDARPSPPIFRPSSRQRSIWRSTSSPPRSASSCPRRNRSRRQCDRIAHFAALHLVAIGPSRPRRSTTAVAALGRKADSKYRLAVRRRDPWKIRGAGPEVRPTLPQEPAAPYFWTTFLLLALSGQEGLSSSRRLLGYSCRASQ